MPINNDQLKVLRVVCDIVVKFLLGIAVVAAIVAGIYVFSKYPSYMMIAPAAIGEIFLGRIADTVFKHYFPPKKR